MPESNQYPHLNAALGRLLKEKTTLSLPAITPAELFKNISYRDLTEGKERWNENELTVVAINALNQNNVELFREAVKAGAMLNKNPTSYYDDLLPSSLKMTYSEATFADIRQVNAYLNAGGNLFLSLDDSPPIRQNGQKKTFTLLNVLELIPKEANETGAFIPLHRLLSNECLFAAFEHSMVTYAPNDSQIERFYTHIFPQLIVFSATRDGLNAQQLNTMSQLHPLPLSSLIHCVRGFFGETKGAFKSLPDKSKHHPAITGEQRMQIKEHWKAILPVFWQEFHLSSDDEYRAKRTTVSSASIQNVVLSKNQEQLILESLSVLSGLMQPEEIDFNPSLNPGVINHLLKVLGVKLPYEETHANAFSLGMIHYLSNKSHWEDENVENAKNAWSILLVRHLLNDNANILSIEWMKNENESTVELYTRLLKENPVTDPCFTLSLLVSILNQDDLANFLNHWDQVTFEKINSILHLPEGLDEGNDHAFRLHTEKPSQQFKEAADLEQTFEELNAKTSNPQEKLYIQCAYHKEVLHRHIISHPELHSSFHKVLQRLKTQGKQNTFAEKIHQKLLTQHIKPVVSEKTSAPVVRF